MSALSTLLLTILLLPVGPTPPAPGSIPVAEARAERPSLEHRLLGNPRLLLESGPEAWCPVGPELDERIATQRRSTSSASPTKAAGAVVACVDGVIVIEDDGTMLRHDRRPDLEGLSLELIPDGAGYRVTQRPVIPEPDIGPALFNDVRDWREEPIDLGGFEFPFGGSLQGSLWATTTFALSFADPEAPGVNQLHLHEQLPDRSMRIAPWQQGSSLAGRDLHYLQLLDRAVFTWRAVEGGWLDVEIQAVLHGDGRIEFHYLSLLGLNHGGPAVNDGGDAWWSDLNAAGSVASPPGEVPVPAPDGPAIDIVEVRASQIADSELMQLEVEFEAPLPADTDGALQFVWDIRDEPGGPIVVQLWAEWQDGDWNWTSYSPEIDGNTIRFRVSKTEMALEDEDFEIIAWAAQDWEYHQAVVAMFEFPRTPTQALMRDFSSADGSTWNGPLFEPFTLPELIIDPIYQTVLEEFEQPLLDGLPVFQNFLTDIVFYAGAWSTVGNAAADGIGTGTASEPVAPALLHMNGLGVGWNSWDEGSVTVLNHEFGHHWLYFPQVDQGGDIGRPLGNGHPAGGVHTPAAATLYNDHDASCMGGSAWTDNGDGTFTSAPSFASYGYSWHELYLMGLADESEVGPWFHLIDSDPGLPGAYWPAENLTVTATRVDVGVDQFVSAMGPRFPAAAESQKDFHAPMVLLVRPGEWTQDDVDELIQTCDLWSEQFHAATLGRATVTCDRVANRPPVPLILDPPPGTRVPVGTTLEFTGMGSDPDCDVVDLVWDLGPMAPPTGGEGPHPVTFTEPGLHVVRLTAVDETGLSAIWPDLRVIEVVCAEPLQEIAGLRVARPVEGTLEFSWDLPVEAVDDGVLFESVDPTGPWALVAEGLPGITTDERSALRFYQLAARNLPDCIGPF